MNHQTGQHESGRLLAEVTCPNCWNRFAPERLLFVARHDSLLGDDIVGPTAYRRFLPTRFNLAGDALDAKGMACQQLACPRCHLDLSRPLIEMLPVFISIVGAPASGKSYYLAALTWEMRRRAGRFGFNLSDSDPVANAQLHGYEETLFMNEDRQTPVALRKTETQGGELYQSVVLDGQNLTFPRPFQFSIQPEDRPRGDESAPYRTLVLYDNAGEHFLPGQDSTAAPVTLHLGESAATFFLFDPTQDARFRENCRSDDPQLRHGIRPGAGTLSRQELILNEMVARVRRYKGLGQAQRHGGWLMILLAKADIWFDADRLSREPFVEGEPWRLDTAAVEAVSGECRSLMAEHCPALVNVAERFSEHVLYLPVSALGGSPELVEQGGSRFYGVRPQRITPRWVTVPLLWALHKHVPGLIAAV